MAVARSEPAVCPVFDTSTGSNVLGVADGRQDERGKRDEEEGEPSGQECMRTAGRGGSRC